MKSLEIYVGAYVAIDTTVTTVIAALETKWMEDLREVYAHIYGMAVFECERWFILQMECVDFSEKHIPERQFQWFIYIFSYLHISTGDMV